MPTLTKVFDISGHFICPGCNNTMSAEYSKSMQYVIVECRCQYAGSFFLKERKPCPNYMRPLIFRPKELLLEEIPSGT